MGLGICVVKCLKSKNAIVIWAFGCRRSLILTGYVLLVPFPRPSVLPSFAVVNLDSNARHPGRVVKSLIQAMQRHGIEVPNNGTNAVEHLIANHNGRGEPSVEQVCTHGRNTLRI